MSLIRSTNTRAEIRMYDIIRKILGKRRIILRNVTSLPGRPDYLIPSLNLIIFIDSCFYHCCPIHGHLPKSNRRYWLPKLSKNIHRDILNRRRLRGMGYGVWRFWEHDLHGQKADRTIKILSNRFIARNARLRGSGLHN